MALNSKWISHIVDDVQKELFKKNLMENVLLFDRLKELLEDKLRDTARSRRSLKSYAINSYGEYQADRNATERTLQEIIDLIPSKDTDNG